MLACAAASAGDDAPACVREWRMIGTLAHDPSDFTQGLAILEARLASNQWLALGRPTIADIACYPYTSRAPEGNIALDPYPAVQAWIKRFEALPGYFKN